MLSLCHFGVCYTTYNLISSRISFILLSNIPATTFLELWKRRQAVIIWEWDLQNVESDEEPRPEFETTVKTFRINPVTREREPYLPVWSKALRSCATGSMVFFMVIKSFL